MKRGVIILALVATAAACSDGLTDPAVPFDLAPALSQSAPVAPTPPAPDSVVLASGATNVSGRDPSNRITACGGGPACPSSLPQDAFVIGKHPAWATPITGTSYIAPVPDGNAPSYYPWGPGGYPCCTTATFDNAFTLPAGATAASITLSMTADNGAIVKINGVEFGRDDVVNQPGSNFSGPAQTFTGGFTPDPSGVNHLEVVLVDGGGALGVDYRATVKYVVDTDGDGVPDAQDAFPQSDLSPTVVIGTCDAGVANQLQSDGATFNDLIGAAHDAARNHGRFVSAVARLADGWKKAGLISGRDEGRITSCAARSR